jgi:threonine dehydratase
MQSLGAEVIEHGRDFDDAREEAEARARNELLRLVHPANEPLLIAGVGTYAMEIAEDLPDADAIFVPIGGGSLVSGTVVALRTMRPGMIYGVQAERADALARSLEHGTLEHIDRADTFADGLATRYAFELPFEILKAHPLDGIVRVTEDEMQAAVKYALEGTHNVAEGAAAAAYAAAFKMRAELRGKKVVIAHSGHNIDRNRLRWALGMFDA